MIFMSLLFVSEQNKASRLSMYPFFPLQELPGLVWFYHT